MCIRFTWPKFGLQAYETRNQNKNNYNSLKIENKRFHGPDPNQSINQHIIGVPEQFRHATKHLIEDAGKCKEKYRTEIINMHTTNIPCRENGYKCCSSKTKKKKTKDSLVQFGQ